MFIFTGVIDTRVLMFCFCMTHHSTYILLFIVGNLSFCVILGIPGLTFQGSDFHSPTLPHGRQDIGVNPVWPRIWVPKSSPQGFEFWAHNTVLAGEELVVILMQWLRQGKVLFAEATIVILP